MIATPVLVLLAAATATVGALGGLGGAVVLVPILVLAGMEPAVAAPLGLISVAAGSLSAAPTQLVHGLVHHRLGLTLELTASAGAVIGALASEQLSDGVLRLVLALSAAAAGIVGHTRSGLRNRPQPAFVAEPPAEWPGTLAGTYLGPGGAIPYRARHVGGGLVAMAIAGVVTGLSGVSGGFIKAPAMRELMHIPVKVAAATTTFTVGITAATALLVVAGQGRIDAVDGAAVALGGLIGGLVGAALQDRLDPLAVRRSLSAVLLLVALVLVAS